MHRFCNFVSRSKLSKWNVKKLRQPSHLGASLSTMRFFTISVDSGIPTKNNFEQDCLLKHQGRIHLPPKKFERVPAEQGLLCEMLPNTPKMISRKLSAEKWNKHIDKHSGESFITNNPEPFDRQSEVLFKLAHDFAEMKTAWQKERGEINIGEFIKAKQFLSRLSCKGIANSRMPLSPQEETLAEERNRNAHRLDLLISIKQVTKYGHLNYGLIFQALYGISLEEVKHLLEMDKRCNGMFQVESIVECHGTLYARQIPSRFLQPFKQWLGGVRKVKSQIDDIVACQGHTATTCSALISRVDDKLLQEVERLSQICKETYESDNSHPAKRTKHHDEAITRDLKERGLLSKFRVI
ncbi:uncharacterized protein Bfra_002647 [Botrytis fragariae]|uniref:Uncharacterized protein n=1 Tax=Botrytis fragariae TaxID=1964551 RepID=A0A8H6AZB7_9HELO|nr:uncharacterized protein Bfra_002647 [Botrytis fragariae]KAF5876245.1 hypothetical protein Bfra_002647 [Botrytis fragariae]